MTRDLLTLDRARLPRVAQADPIGYLADLVTPAQACRAVFLAAEVGAIVWNRDAWPDLAFGIWSDETPAGTERSARRRRLTSAPTTELTTWLQLKPEWPQLGGASISWPLDDAGSDVDARLAGIVSAAVDALNAIHRSTLDMVAQLAEPLTVSIPRARPSPASGRRTFTAAGVASSEHDVPRVLADLVTTAETDHDGVVAHLGHAVTMLPNGVPHSHNGTLGRFLVTLTATIESPEADSA